MLIFTIIITGTTAMLLLQSMGIKETASIYTFLNSTTELGISLLGLSQKQISLNNFPSHCLIQNGTVVQLIEVMLLEIEQATVH